MIRQDINLGEYKYVVDLYKTGIDTVEEHHESFVMIRNIKVMNDVATDDSVYFIQKSIFDECKKEDGKFDFKELGNHIVFPVRTGAHVEYSTKIEDFNESIYGGYDVNEIYELIDGNYVENTKIPCDKLRIYMPTVNNKLDAIVCVYNYINGIHFYYLCKTLSQYKVNAYTEFEYSHYKYSEFYDIYIPSVEALFEPYRMYIVDDLNINMVRQHFEDTTIINSVLTNVSTTINIQPDIVDNELKNIMNFNMFVNGSPNVEFSINDKTYCTGVKQFEIKRPEVNKLSKTYDDIVNDINSLNDTLKGIHIESIQQRFLYIITASYIYDKDDGDTFKLPEYATEFKTLNTRFFTFASTSIMGIHSNNTTKYSVLGCEEHVVNNGLSEYVENNNIVALSTLLLPFSIETNNGVSRKVFDTAYNNYINIYTNMPVSVSMYQYSGISNEMSRYINDMATDENSDVFVKEDILRLQAGFTFIGGQLMVTSNWNYINSNLTACEYYKAQNNVTYQDYLKYEGADDEEHDIDFETSINKIGYRIEISDNANFENIVYKLDKSNNIENLTPNDFIGDFAFQLNGVFDSWNALPEMLVIRTVFVDRMLHNIIYSNVLFLGKEQFKYFINNSLIHRIHMDNSKFYFIDKINAVVSNKKNESKDGVNMGSNIPRIMYKPIFYRVSELQNIKIKQSIKQNIGVNLSDMFTKVETFKMVIDGTEYIEIGRNDIYAIFNVDASKIKKQGGRYYIINQDDDYISDGTWSIY